MPASASALVAGLLGPVRVVALLGAGLVELRHADADHECPVAHRRLSFDGCCCLLRDRLVGAPDQFRKRRLQERGDLLAAPAIALEPLPRRRLGHPAVGAEDRVELGWRIGGGAEAEHLDQPRRRLLAGIVEDGLDLGVVAEALGADGGEPGLAVALDHLEPAVDRLVEAGLRRRAVDVLGDGLGAEADHLADDLDVELALRSEVVVDETAGDVCLGGDLGRRDVAVAALGEDAGGRRRESGGDARRRRHAGRRRQLRDRRSGRPSLPRMLANIGTLPTGPRGAPPDVLARLSARRPPPLRAVSSRIRDEIGSAEGGE